MSPSTVSSICFIHFLFHLAELFSTIGSVMISLMSIKIFLFPFFCACSLLPCDLEHKSRRVNVAPVRVDHQICYISWHFDFFGPTVYFVQWRRMSNGTVNHGSFSWEDRLSPSRPSSLARHTMTILLTVQRQQVWLVVCSAAICIIYPARVV
ncbi:hypothetical protein DFH28DRAFT_423619 [Melampsora americana]|nr:hypothetical protein DFH28DRAFT_423619 [Melampsora americana]